MEVFVNRKACKELRKAIREQYPNLDPKMQKHIFKEGKRQFLNLSHVEKGKPVIEIKGAEDVRRKESSTEA